MNAVDERFMIYAALALLCSTASTFLGATAGLWSFLQIAAVIEFLYWIGLPSGGNSAQSRYHLSQ
ncbi:MAG: hypothetical protein ACJAZ0_002683 [Halioglobus sp.]|jgi:hypothetical protein